MIMLYLNYLLAALLCVGMPTHKKISWIVQKSSSLSINGRTNVNKFSCGVAQYSEPDTITFLGPDRPDKSDSCRRFAHGTIPLCGTLKINIGDFDCRNRMMTGEFKKTLQYQQYPQLKITFVNLERMPAFGPQPETLKGLVTIELAGASKQIEMDYVAGRENAGMVELTGSRQLCFSDFGLKPPQKMGGLIRVNDVLDVQFILSLRRMD